MSNKKNLFNSVQVKKLDYNTVDLCHTVATSGQMGNLIPVMCSLTNPGDVINLGVDSLTRFAPLVNPVYQQMNLSIHYFYCPIRSVWPDYEEWVTDDPGNSGIDFPVFQVAANGANYTKLMNYLRIPDPALVNAIVDETGLSAVPFAIYQYIYNEYYRDQNLIPAVNWELVQGDNSSNADLFQLRKRAWSHDYFTSNLPSAQLGAPVRLPIGNFEDVAVKVNATPTIPGTIAQWPFPSTTPPGGSGTTGAEMETSATFGPNALLYAETSALVAQAALLTDLRTAWQMQSYKEKSMRSGNRYNEWLKAHYDVEVGDYRVNRPEYITGVKSSVRVSEVLSTAETTAAPQGNMAGHAYAVTAGQGGHYTAREIGFVIGIASVIPETYYFQGIPRHFLKTNNPTDYFTSEFAHIGEQVTFQREIYAYQHTGLPNDPDPGFGYNPRYAEYKFENNYITGDMQSTLLDWTLARDFGSFPSLNQAFIECDPSNRIFAVTSPGADNLWLTLRNNYYARRKMPIYGTPTTL